MFSGLKGLVSSYVLSRPSESLCPADPPALLVPPSTSVEESTSRRRRPASLATKGLSVHLGDLWRRAGERKGLEERGEMDWSLGRNCTDGLKIGSRVEGRSLVK